jgi:hypothetical protein
MDTNFAKSRCYKPTPSPRIYLCCFVLIRGFLRRL